MDDHEIIKAHERRIKELEQDNANHHCFVHFQEDELMDSYTDHNKTLQECRDLQARIKELEEAAEIMIAQLDTLICVHCEKIMRVEGITDEQCRDVMAEHFKVCEKHPVSIIQPRIDAAKKLIKSRRRTALLAGISIKTFLKELNEILTDDAPPKEPPA